MSGKAKAKAAFTAAFGAEAAMTVSKITRARQIVSTFAATASMAGKSNVTARFTAAFAAVAEWVAGVAPKNQLKPEPLPTRAEVEKHSTRAQITPGPTRAQITTQRTRAKIEPEPTTPIVKRVPTRTKLH